MTDSELLIAFIKAMGGEWVVDRYSVDEDSGKLRIHYVSLLDKRIVWAHNPHGALRLMPKIGAIGMLGFMGEESVKAIKETENER